MATVLKLLGALAIAQLFHPEAVCLCNSSSRGFIDSNCRAACALSTSYLELSNALSFGCLTIPYAQMGAPGWSPQIMLRSKKASFTDYTTQERQPAWDSAEPQIRWRGIPGGLP